MRSSEIRLRKLKLRLRDRSKRFANHMTPCTANWQQSLQSVLAPRGCSATDLIKFTILLLVVAAAALVVVVLVVVAVAVAAAEDPLTHSPRVKSALLSLSNIVIYHQSYLDITNIMKLPVFTRL